MSPDDNTMRWLAAHSTLTRRGKLEYVKMAAVTLSALMSLESRNEAAQANFMIENFELELCDVFETLAAELVEMPAEMDWNETVAWCNVELEKCDV